MHKHRKRFYQKIFQFRITDEISIYHLIRNRSTKTLYQRLIARWRFRITFRRNECNVQQISCNTISRFASITSVCLKSSKNVNFIWSLSFDENHYSYKTYDCTCNKFRIIVTWMRYTTSFLTKRFDMFVISMNMQTRKQK